MERRKESTLIHIPTEVLPPEIDSKGKNAVLLYTGSFCPIHLNHIRTIIRARELFTTKGFHVLALYVIPTHDDSLKKKLNSLPISKEHRLAMLKLAITPDFQKWVAIVDSFLTEGKIRNLGIGEVRRQIVRTVEETYKGADVKFITVMGIDNIETAIRVASKGDEMYLITNRKSDFEKYKGTQE